MNNKKTKLKKKAPKLPRAKSVGKWSHLLTNEFCSTIVKRYEAEKRAQALVVEIIGINPGDGE